MKLEELVTQGKKRHVALTGMWKPYQTILSICSGALFVYRFFKNSGEFTFTLLGLAALTFFLLYYATTISGIKLPGAPYTGYVCGVFDLPLRWVAHPYGSASLGRRYSRNPFNPQSLISHLTNSNGCGNL